MAQGAGEPGNGFPAALRKHRLAAGLTQDELAERAGIGVRTVRELERGRVGRPQRGTVALLAEALGLSGGPQEAFLDAARKGADLVDPTGPGNVTSGHSPGPALAGAATAGEAIRPRVPRPRTESTLPDVVGPATVATRLIPGAATAAPLPAVPPRPDVVGRDDEISGLTTLLPQSRVVTLTGLAGVGKTCLALAVIHECASSFPGGVSGMAISDDARRDDLLAAVASVFEMARAVDLIERYARTAALIMFDGADRSPRAAAEAIRWLRARVPKLTILVTSRHPLGVPGEVHRRIEPLDVPPPDRAERDVAALRAYPAVALFLDRLHQVRPDPVADTDAPVLAELVRRLGGLPLALELAAARGRVLDLPELLGRYRYRVLDLGTVAPEGETLREAVAASYRLLEPEHQWALRRLSVFRSRWSLELAEDLLYDTTDASAAKPGPDVEAILDRLLALGLLNVRPAIEFRFRLLDMVHDFAAEECAAHGETMAARAGHARVVARLTTRTAPDLVGATMPAAVARLDHLAADVRSALGFAAVHDPSTALRIGSAIVRWRRFRGRDRENRVVLRRLLEDPRTASAGAVARAWAAVGTAMLAVEHGEGLVEASRAQAALDVFTSNRNVDGELAARFTLCRVWQAVGRYDDARRHGSAALALAERTGRFRDMAVALHALAWHDIQQGDLRAARISLRRAAALGATAGDARIGATVAAGFAELARLEQAYEDSVEQGRAALRVLVMYGDPGHRIRALCTVGRALVESGRLAEAEAVLSELAGYRTAAGAVRVLVEAYLQLARGERRRAAEAFRAAAEAMVGRHDLRDVLEALVGAVASTDDDEIRADLLRQVTAISEHNGLILLPRDRAMLGRTAAAPR